MFKMAALAFLCGFISIPSIAFADEPILPIVKPQGLDAKKVELGKQLFHDPMLSKDGSVSCSTCHDLGAGGVDGLPRSLGVDDQEGGINSPTVFNSALNFKQFWNGRAETLEEQAGGPITNPIEMGNNWDKVLQTLNADDDYKKSFKAAFADGITPLNIRSAIAEFERSLTLDNSRFDAYLKGDSSAITDNEKKGYVLFKDYGCIACHQGSAVGGNMFQTFGIMGDYFKDRATPITDADLGRYVLTKREEDKHVFKVPSLRMVTSTAPYFHDGSVKTLAEAIKVMAKYQLGRTLSDEDIKLIASFLGSLAGPYDSAN